MFVRVMQMYSNIVTYWYTTVNNFAKNIFQQNMMVTLAIYYGLSVQT